MSEPGEYDPLASSDRGIPVWTDQGERIFLHAANTAIHRYEEGDGDFDHCSVRLEDGEEVRVPIGGEILDDLQRMGCPAKHVARPDEETREFFIISKVRDLEDQLERGEGFGQAG